MIFISTEGNLHFRLLKADQIFWILAEDQASAGWILPAKQIQISVCSWNIIFTEPETQKMCPAQ